MKMRRINNKKLPRMFTKSVVIGIPPDTDIEKCNECIICCTITSTVKPIQCNEFVDGVMCRQVWLLCDICRERNYIIRNTNCLICKNGDLIDQHMSDNEEINDTEETNETRLYIRITEESCTCFCNFILVIAYHLIVSYTLGAIVCWHECSDSLETKMVIGFIIYMMICAVIVTSRIRREV